MEDIKLALQLKGQLDKLRPIKPEQENRIMQKFRLDWNYHSNNLEGNSLTYGETKALLLFNVTAQGKPLKDHLEVTGHNEAINWVIDMVKDNRPLTENFIRELHQLLLKESYEVDAITPDGKPTKKRIAVGSYKSSPNHVKTKTGEIFYFASPEETPAKMADLMAWYNEKKDDAAVNPIFFAAEFHYKFIRIHPFDDGNGRTARILMNFILMKYGFPPVIIKTEDKENYFAALRLADADNIEAFINYIAVNLVHSLEIMLAGARGEAIEEPDDIDKEIALLEKRLASYGEDVEKIRSIKLINEIFSDSIYPLAIDIKKKLSKFEKYYLHHSISLYEDDTLIDNTNPILVNKNYINKIRLVVDYNTLKKKGLEDFGFYYEVIFKFDTFDYSVFLNDDNDEPIFIKFYEKLTRNDQINLISNLLLI